MIDVNCNYHDENAQVVNHQYQVKTYAELKEAINQYPWHHEIEQFEQSGEGGGITLSKQQDEFVIVSYLLVPIDFDVASLDVDVRLSRGWLGFIGGKSVSYSYPPLSYKDALGILKEIVDSSVEHLYQQYQLKK